MTITTRLAQIEAQIGSACTRAGRHRSSVSLLAASKTVDLVRIRDAIDAGIHLFGESRAQELRDKAPALAAHLHPPQWHFIGRLQRNKVKYVVRWASLIHTVDTIALATEIATRAPRPIGVLVQVNTGTDPAKGGVAPDQALTLCQQIDALDNIELCGLMTLPPWTDDPDGASPFFATLGRLAEAGRQHELPLHTLSMGMSRDFEGAIAHGATIIRLGTALFGPRPARPTI